MRAIEHLRKGEAALEGAKDMIRQAESVGPENDTHRRARLLDSATFLIAVSNAHANLGRLSNQIKELP